MDPRDASASKKSETVMASLLESKFNSQVCDCMEISVGGAICKELALN